MKSMLLEIIMKEIKKGNVIAFIVNNNDFGWLYEPDEVRHFNEKELVRCISNDIGICFNKENFFVEMFTPNGDQKVIFRYERPENYNEKFIYQVN